MKLLNYISYLTLVTAFICVGVLGFWSLYPYKPNDIKSLKILDTVVTAGGTLSYEVSYCKETTLHATVTRSFVNGVIFTTNTVSGDVPMGCHTNKVYIVVPQELPSGTYSLRILWVYKVNPIREVALVLDSNKFQIIGSDLDRQADQITNKE
jgi:hypothetical protein